jgi:hypothetical protein
MWWRGVGSEGVDYGEGRRMSISVKWVYARGATPTIDPPTLLPLIQGRNNWTKMNIEDMPFECL